MSEKYYRLLRASEKPKASDVVCMENSNGEYLMELGKECGDFVNASIIFRPVTLPQVGWLPIGEKKEFEEGTLFGEYEGGLILAVSFSCDEDRNNVYLPPLPVLDGVKEPVLTKSQKREIFEQEMKAIALDELATAKARISELEESLHKAEDDCVNKMEELDRLSESLRRGEQDIRTLTLERDTWYDRAMEDSPTWQELAKFEGDIPKGWLVVSEGGCAMFTVDPAPASFWIDKRYRWVIARRKPDNSARIAELMATIQGLKVENATFNNEMLYNDRKLREMEAELAKLKDRS